MGHNPVLTHLNWVSSLQLFFMGTVHANIDQDNDDDNDDNDDGRNSRS